MDEVTRCLPGLKLCLTIGIKLFGSCFVTILHIIFTKEGVFVRNLRTFTMFVAGIDIATTLDILLHIDQVELNDTGNVTIDLLGRCTLL